MQLTPMPWRASLPVAAASGVLLMFAFPPHGLWPLAPVAAAGLSLAAHGRSARAGALLGLIFGLAFFLPLLYWAGTYVGAVPWLILAVFEACYLALMGAALPLVQRLPGWPAWVAGLWVAQEAIRGRVPFGGFPWGRLAFSQPTGPYLPYAAVAGTALITFALALTGALIAYAVVNLGHLRMVALTLAGAIVVVPGAGALAGLSVHRGVDAPTTTVAVVQGNVPRLGLEFNEQRRAVLDNHVQATLDLAKDVEAGERPQPDIVIWPENSSDVNPYTDATARAEIDRAARAIGVPILVGGMLDGPGDKRRNVGIVWDPETGPGERYVKRHPVPFGEYIPLRSLARKVTDKVDLVPRDMVAGDKVGVLDMAGLTIGDVICFEVAYDGVVRDTVSEGAELLAVQTNNATFGWGGETSQQLAMARIRAVEFNRSTIVSSTSGISAIIAPDGTVLQESDIFTRTVFDQPVALVDGTTLATRLGVVPEWVLAGLGVAALIAAVVISRRRGEPEEPSPIRVREREPA